MNQYKITVRGKGALPKSVDGINPIDAFSKVYSSLELESTKDVFNADVCIELLNGKRKSISYFIAKSNTQIIGTHRIKDISFAAMMKISQTANNTISFNKFADLNLMPKGYKKGILVTAKKSEYGDILNKYHIVELVVNMYRDKSGSNDLRRLKELGFEIQAQTLGESNGTIPARDYYYMIREMR